MSEWVECRYCKCSILLEAVELDIEGNWICGESYKLECFDELLERFGELL